MLHGCGFTHLLDTKSQVGYYKQLGKWDQVVLHYDIQESHNLILKEQLLNSLKNNGFYQLPLHTNISTETQYECAWRLSQWDINDKTDDVHSVNNYEKAKYVALKSLHENDESSFNQAIVTARNAVIESLRHVSLESSESLYAVLSQLQSLQEVEDFSDKKRGEGDFEFVLKKWKEQDMINLNHFQYVEPIRAQRVTVLKDVLREKVELKKNLIDMYLELAGVFYY